MIVFHAQGMKYTRLLFHYGWLRTVRYRNCQKVISTGSVHIGDDDTRGEYSLILPVASKTKHPS